MRTKTWTRATSFGGLKIRGQLYDRRTIINNGNGNNNGNNLSSAQLATARAGQNRNIIFD